MLEKESQKTSLVYAPSALVEVTKEILFDSCHQLLNYDGACARMHGHTYKLQVTVKGLPNNIGIVLDFKTLKNSIKELILDELDHYNLNDKLNFNTTAENMVVYFYDLILGSIIGMPEYHTQELSLVSIRLWETPTSFAEYKGERHYVVL